MSIYRAGLAALAMLFGTLVASAAFAGCGGCCGGCGGYAVTYAPAAYAPPPMAYAPPSPPMAYLPPPAPQPLVAPAPVAPVPLAPAPIAVDHWDTGGWGCGAWTCSSWGGWSGWGGWGGSSWGGGWGGCGCCGGCRGLFTAGFAAVPAPIYVVNQGPYYSGPGVMVPYGTYSPYNGVAGPYPYVGGYGYPHYAYHRHYYRRPYPHYWRG